MYDSITVIVIMDVRLYRLTKTVVWTVYNPHFNTSKSISRSLPNRNVT